MSDDAPPGLSEDAYNNGPPYVPPIDYDNLLTPSLSPITKKKKTHRRKKARIAKLARKRNRR